MSDEIGDAQRSPPLPAPAPPALRKERDFKGTTRERGGP
jgi:hypothetical protein